MLSTMSRTTLLPFLYQTRTLSCLDLNRLGLKHLNARFRHSRGSNSDYSVQSSTPLAKPWTQRGVNSEYGSQNTTESQGFEIRRVPNVGLGAATAPHSSKSLMSRRPLLNRRGDDFTQPLSFKNTSTTRKKQEDTSGLDDFSIPIEEGLGSEEDEMDRIFAKQRNTRTQDNLEFGEQRQSGGGRASTITTEEKAAFQRIFSDIFERQKVAAAALPYAQGSEIEFEGMDPKSRRRHAAEQEINSLLAQTAPASVMSNYPVAIRESAAQAFNALREEMVESISKTQETVDAESDQDAQREQRERLEALREPERARIEKLMHNASTDVELWQVMEKDVFSLIPMLGLEPISQEAEVSSGPNQKGQKKTKKLAKPSKESATIVQPPKKPASTSTKDGVPLLALYGPLYPSFLLLGLRLLDRSFSKPSSLTVSLLPKIKSLGFISHVLGANTQFYNELLRIYRYRLDDLKGMHDLLDEMEQAALDMDAETYAIVSDVVRMQFRVKDGDGGENLAVVWKFPRYSPSGPHCFRHWKDRIAQAIERQKQHEEEVHEEGGSWQLA